MKNLIRLYNESPDFSGLNWYFEANSFAQSVANKYSLPLNKVCGMFSALSPGTNYEQNKKDLIAMIEINQGIKRKGYKFVTYGQNILKAQNIYNDILEPDNAFNPKTGAKTYNFYYNILLPDSPEYCTIDRHAYRIATGKEYNSLTPKQYRDIAGHYVKAANKIGILPNQLQAILWVNFREQKGIKPEIYCPF